ncbi:MAG: putative C-S lyase [Porphyromonadaceae bacterium]|nr:MAG: putative C-S lyase [Porphyromonadaceae bacterium]
MDGKLYTQEDFDRIINRVGTDSIKWDGRERVFGQADVIPLWVADMDFETPEFIRKRIARRLEHPILGYTYRGEGFAGSFTRWVRRRLDWTVDPAWITFMPGVVPAVSLAVLTYTRPDDEVIIQPPVYHPFYFCVEGHGRKLILNHLIHKNGRFTFDLELLKSQITPKTRMLVLSSPHNPGGTVWTPEELSGLVSVCKDHDIWIVSDEIHSDLIFSPNRHTPILKVAEDYRHRILVAMAPSKTFNLAAMSTSIVVIPDQKERKHYEDLVHTLHIGMGNVFGIEALQAAYEEGDQWLDQLLIYLLRNRQFIYDFLRSEIPRVEMMVPEATYMTWLDFRKLGVTPDALNKFIIEKAGLGLNNGTQFGPGGEGFMRLNFGCPRSLLERAMQQLKDAINT